MSKTTTLPPPKAMYGATDELRRLQLAYRGRRRRAFDAGNYDELEELARKNRIVELLNEIPPPTSPDVSFFPAWGAPIDPYQVGPVTIERTGLTIPTIEYQRPPHRICEEVDPDRSVWMTDAGLETDPVQGPHKLFTACVTAGQESQDQRPFHREIRGYESDITIPGKALVSLTVDSTLNIQLAWAELNTYPIVDRSTGDIHGGFGFARLEIIQQLQILQGSRVISAGPRVVFQDELSGRPGREKLDFGSYGSRLQLTTQFTPRIEPSNIVTIRELIEITAEATDATAFVTVHGQWTPAKVCRSLQAVETVP